jgi:autotransporter-associated beta strand protein
MKTRALLFVPALFVTALHAQTVTWSVAGGGSWNTAASWNPAAVPTATDAVVFNHAPTAAATVTLGANQAVASLDFSANTSNIATTLTGGGTNRTLVISGALTASGVGNLIVGSTTSGQNVALTATTVTKRGTGNLELANANTLGDLSIEQGRLFGRNANAFGAANSGTITLGSVAAANNIEFRCSTATYAAKPIVLGPTTGWIRIDTLGATSPTVSFPVTGTNNLEITATSSGTVAAPTNGVLVYNTGPVNPTGNLVLKNLGATGTGNSQVTLNAAVGANVVNVSVQRNAGIGSGSFIRISNPANAWTGTTTVAAGALLQLGASEVLPHGTAAGNLVVDGTLDLSIADTDTTETVNGLSGAATGVIRRSGATAAPATSTLVFGGKDASGTYAGTFLETNGKIALTKVGEGEITLSAATNGHTGATRVLGGKLNISGAAFLPVDSLVEIGGTGVLNLAYSGTTSVSSFRINGVSQAAGLWGRVGSIAELGAQFENSRITGDGLIDNTNASGVVHWDGSGTSWGSVSAWSYSPEATTPDPVNSPSTTFGAVFSASTVSGPQTVQIDGDREAADLRFSSTQDHTLVGGSRDSSVSIGSGGLVVDAAAKAPVIGSATSGQKVILATSEPQSWTNDSTTGPLTALNGIDGYGKALTLKGAGDFTIAGPVFSFDSLTLSQAGMVLFSGDVSGINNLVLGGTGDADFTGTLEVGGSLQFNRTANLTITGEISGSATLSKKGTGVFTLAGKGRLSGDATIDAGQVVIEGDHSAASSGWLLRGYGTSTAYNTVATTLRIGSAAKLGIASGKTVQAGNVSPSGGFTAQLVESFGTVVNDGALSLGRAGALAVKGGQWTQNGTALVATQGGGQASVLVTDGGVVDYTNAAAFQLNTSTSTNTRTKLTVDGGTFRTGVGINNAQATAATGTNAEVILLNGGQLTLTANVLNFLTTAGAGIRFEVGAGGGVIDTGAFSTQLSVPLEGAGGLVKKGSGTLTTTAANTYLGDTTVEGGKLSLATAGLADAAAVTVAQGAVLDLAFTGDDVVESLVIAGTDLPAGTYDATTHPGTITGSGRITVVPAPDATFATWATELGLSGVPTADFDGDGLSDVLEYVLGSDPKAANRSPITSGEAGGAFVLTFPRDDRSETPDLALAVNSGTDLGSWPGVFNVGAATADSSPGVTIVENGDQPDTVTVTIPKNGATRLFTRVKATVAEQN